MGTSLGAVMEVRGTKSWLGGEGRKEALVSGAGWEAGGWALLWLPAPAEGVSWHAGTEGEGEHSWAGCGGVTQPAVLPASQAAT